MRCICDGDSKYGRDHYTARTSDSKRDALPFCRLALQDLNGLIRVYLDVTQNGDALPRELNRLEALEYEGRRRVQEWYPVVPRIFVDAFTEAWNR